MQHLVLAYKQTQDTKTRDLIIKHYLYLVSNLTNKQNVSINDKEDLQQEASIELLDALEDYNPDKGTLFKTFAYSRIVGRIKQFLRDKAWLIKIPQKLYVLNGKINRARNKLKNKLLREPTEIELFYELGITYEQYHEAQSALMIFGANIISTDECNIGDLADDNYFVEEFEEETISSEAVKKHGNNRTAWQKIVNEVAEGRCA